jgi:hypothetical protein
LEAVKFVVDESPYACWDWELRKKNLEFLEGIDSGYFRYVSEINIANIENEDKHKAAIALRLAFSHGLETLFSLLCSAVQAPHCSIGWLLSYKNYQLINLVEKISKSEPCYTCFKILPVTWDELAKYIHSGLAYEKEKIEWIQKGFGKIWSCFADEFTDASFTLEYNGIKHGLRAKPGGFDLAFGPEVTPGVPAPPEKMQSLGGSSFGSTYFVKEHIIPTDKLNFRPRRHSRNWSPQNLANGLFLISMSIQNIASWLRMVNGVPPNKCRFENPISEDVFEQPWIESVGVTHVSFDLIIEAGHMKPFSQEEIFQFYKEIKK